MSGQNLLKAINRSDIFKISFYQIKKEIYNDADLKKAYFQAVSNFSWANYGYLVAFEFNDNLLDELESLSQSFGIGVIELSSNTYQSKVLFPAKYNDLDFRTIDKICRINADFNSFIEHIEKLLSAEDKYFNAIEKEFNDFCDTYFENVSEIEDYCKSKNIPFDYDL